VILCSRWKTETVSEMRIPVAITVLALLSLLLQIHDTSATFTLNDFDIARGTSHLIAINSNT